MTTLEESSKCEGMSTWTQSGKSADFLGMVQDFFGSLAKHSRGLIGFLVVLVIVGGGVSYFMNQRETQSGEARNILFLAEQTVDTQTKTLAEKDRLTDLSDKSKVTPVKTPAETDTVDFKKLDVDTVYKNSVEKLQGISTKYAGTRPAFEAELYLGNLYYKHGNSTQALTWYQKAMSGARGSLEKAFAFSALGYAQENTQQYQPALQSFESGLNLGESMIKGDLLLAMARVQAKLGQKDLAKGTYDRILKELPNTEFAKSAEHLKGLL